MTKKGNKILNEKSRKFSDVKRMVRKFIIHITFTSYASKILIYVWYLQGIPVTVEDLIVLGVQAYKKSEHGGSLNLLISHIYVIKNIRKLYFVAVAQLYLAKTTSVC